MRIEHHQVTVIDLRDGKSRCFSLQRENGGFKLSAVSKDDVLHLWCSAADLLRLREALGLVHADSTTVVPDRPEPPAERTPTAEPLSALLPGRHASRWSEVEWLAYN
jgi:hypothetical protein